MSNHSVLLPPENQEGGLVKPKKNPNAGDHEFKVPSINGK